MLGDLVDICKLVYLENILIYLYVTEDHTSYVRAVFERLANLKLYLKCKKYTLFLPEVQSLWYVVSVCEV